MCEIPIIPPLNFEKDGKNHYIFKINDGEIFIQEKKYFKLTDININIYNSIEIKCMIHVLKNYASYLEVYPFGCMSFDDVSDLNLNIKCSTDKYDILIHSFHIKKKNEFEDILDGYESYIVIGCCDEINFIHKGHVSKNGIKKVWSILECKLGNTRGPCKRFKSEKLNDVYLKSYNAYDFKIENKSDETVLDEKLKKQNESFNQLLNNDSFLYYEFDDSEEKFIEIIDNFGAVH